MTNIDAWGPWASGLNSCERTARLRSLRSLLHILAGPRSRLACAFLALAEDEADDDSDETFLLAALAAFNRLPTRDQRSTVAAFGSVHCRNWN
jgi:hypothetical protein